MPIALARETVETPLGAFTLVADRDGVLCAADFADCESRMRGLLDRRFGPAGYDLLSERVPATIKAALTAYFNGDLPALDRIALSTAGSAFQHNIWTAVRTIAPGRTLTYAQLAHRVGRHRAARAVGRANGANPLCIVIPCHRLVGASGALTGYAGGIERKRWLLEHEARHAAGLGDRRHAATKPRNHVASPRERL